MGLVCKAGSCRGQTLLLAHSLCTILCILWACLMHDLIPAVLLQGDACQQRVMLRCAV